MWIRILEEKLVFSHITYAKQCIISTAKQHFNQYVDLLFNLVCIEPLLWIRNKIKWIRIQEKNLKQKRSYCTNIYDFL